MKKRAKSAFKTLFAIYLKTPLQIFFFLNLVYTFSDLSTLHAQIFVLKCLTAF